MRQLNVLVVDPDPAAEGAYRALFDSAFPCELRVLAEPAAALEYAQHESPDIVLLAESSSWDTIALLAEFRARDPQVPVVLVTTQPQVSTATAALRLGAGDYLAEPLDAPLLRETLQRLLAVRRQDDERELLRRQVERPYVFDDIIGTCAPMTKVFELIQRVADSDVDVLVVGETGTGKELVARAIHRRSRRAEGPFVPVDCGAIPENLLESEFFGHERGAFTGADARQIGLLEFADGGTFFLDELGELPLLLQAKLLRTLQERKIRRVGGRGELEINVRVVAATGRNLEQMIQDGRFRRDLYYRINVVRIDLPPLRERGDDLGLLAEHFATKYTREMGRILKGITPEAYQVLSQYAWPGNVRELQNVIRRAVALSQGSMIGLDDLPDTLITSAGQAAQPAPRGYFAMRDAHVAMFERGYLSDLLGRHRGDVKAAADEAQLPRGTLYRLMKLHDLDSRKFK